MMLLSAVCFAGAAQPLPLTGDLQVHDPVMIRQGDTYYIFHTGRGISVKTSKDMHTWTNAGSVFDRDHLPAWHKDDIPEQNGHLWAPDITCANGVYHLYYSVSAWMNFDSSVGYATNTTLDPADPAYKWIDRGKVIDFRNGGEGVNVIDPNLFVDADGKWWLAYGSYKAGLRLVELNPATGKPFSATPPLTVITTSLGEGVFIIRSADHYYIVASRGICCKGVESTYQMVMGRAKNIQGPYLTKDGKSWQDNRYTLLLAGDGEEPGRGHNGFFTENDTTYIVYHAYTRSANGASLLNIRPLYIDKDGWLSVEPEGNMLFKRVMQ
jgi:arabinan endo-1,5-alpha-L-arabinosidase